MKIYYLLAQFPSTTEHFVANEMKSLTNKGMEIIILSIKKDNNSFKSEKQSLHTIIYNKPFTFQSLLAHFICLRFYTRTYLLELSKAIKRIFFSPIQGCKDLKYIHYSVFFISTIRNLSTKHIHAHFANMPATVASIISRITSMPYSISAHANDIYVEDPLLEDKLHNAQFVVTCTKANKDHLDLITKKDNVYHVYHGIDIEKWVYKPRYYKLPLKKVKILTIGRLVEKKGIVFLLKALKILSSDIDFECSIVGDGPEEPILRSYIVSLNLVDKVKMIGSLPQCDLLKLYHDYDIFLLPCIVSRNGDRDGLPNVLVEALATGLPTISTNVSAIQELIKNGENGILVPEKNEHILASAIKEILLNPMLMNLFSLNGRKTIEEKFKIGHCTDQLYRLFEKEIKV